MTLARLSRTAALVAAMLFAAAAANAQAPPRAENLDLTMVLLPENATGAQEIARRIELPPATAARNGERRGEPPVDAGDGRDTAAEARERGREFGQDVADQARDNRENASRGNGNNGNGQGPPETPGPPGSAGPPDSANPPSAGGPSGGGPPDSPGRPDPPGRPDDPGRP